MKINFINAKLSSIAIAIIAFVGINLVASFLYLRYDLTSEKRYTLSRNTKELLRSLDKSVRIEIYLDGELNSGFRLLAKSTREMADEMEVLSGIHLRYEFIDVASVKDEDKKPLLKMLSERKMDPIPVFETLEDGSKKQTQVYPYMVMKMGDKELVVNLLENLPGLSGSENLNKSIEVLEFKFTDAIRRLKSDVKPKVAFLEGHGELDEYDVMDVTHQLSQYYQVERGSIQQDASVLSDYKCVIVAAPTAPFSEKDKFILNQYVMNGGSVLWLVDGLALSLDGLQERSTSIGLPLDLNLDDMLFKYGFRINRVTVQDIQCAMIPVNVAKIGEAPKFVPAPWMFNPLLLPAQNSPITKSINVVKGEFVSTIDSVGEDNGLKRKVLLASSRFSKISKPPVMVSLFSVNEKPKKEEFTHSFLPVAMVAEGEFPSLFEFRASPVGVSNVQKAVSVGKSTKMILVADGDLIRNEVRFKESNPQIIPLGYDEVNHQTYGNKDFIVNSVNYLADDGGWMALRNRSNVLRLLDKAKVAEDALFYKLLNVVTPLVLLILLGIGYNFYRKRG